jgi:uncharacterized coiled-coil protein SlyX
VQSQADVLGNALAGMVADLRTAVAELRKHQEHLTELVEERTRQVQQEKQEPRPSPPLAASEPEQA